MNVIADQSSAWISDCQKQLVRGKHVLLYGNVADRFLVTEPGPREADGVRRRYVSLDGFLEEHLGQEGYQVVGRYDIVDGVRFADPAMRSLFDQIVATARGGAVEVGAARGEAGLRGPSSTVVTALAGATGVGQDRRPPRAESARYLRQPELALPAIREALCQDQTAAAFVIDFSDMLASSPDRQTEKELETLVQLNKIVHGAAYLSAGHRLHGLRNVLVLVARQLGRVPPWFYRDNPLLATVHVTPPQTGERLSYVRTFLPAFHGGDGSAAAPAERDRVAQSFTDLTDGLTFWDLEALRRTSIAERLTIARPRELVDYYKHGRKEDPWEKLDAAKVQDARRRLEAQVIGQPEAVGAVVDMLVAARVGITSSEVTATAGKPKGVFFFVGPTGVGKTELAKALAELVFDDRDAIRRFDMSEFAQEHAAEKLTGSPPGFVGYEEGGQLTGWVRNKPFSVLLFDEIEKGHPKVMDKFLQILEDGRLTDGKGETAYFSQSVIVFTSNIGSDTLPLAEAAAGKDAPDYAQVRRHFLKAVERRFSRKMKRPELFNRLGDNVIVFDLLRPDFVAAICQKRLDLLVHSAERKRGLRLVFDRDAVIGLIARRMREADNLLRGGRRIKTLVETLVDRPLCHWVFLHDPRPGTKVVIGAAPSGSGITINGQVVK